MTRTALGRLAASFFAIACLGLASPALSQDESRFGFSIGNDVTNAYFFRGVLQEREGFITQPYAEATYSVFSAEDGPIRDITVGAGFWGSFHSETTGASDSPSWFYEADYYPFVSVDLAGNVNFTTIYYFYTSPNDAFTTAQELNFSFAWDDAEAWDFPLQPWVNFAIETKNTLLGTDEGLGMQAGIEPTLYAAENESFTLTAPAEIGLGLSNYYESASGGENTFGYAKVGLAASIPLTFIPESAGAWSLGLNASYYFFSSTLEGSDSASTFNRGRSTYPVGTLSLGVEF